MTAGAEDTTQMGEAGAHASGPLPAAPLPPPRAKVRLHHRPAFWVVTGGVVGVTLLLLGLAVFLLLGIENNPMVSRMVRDRIITALEERIDPSLSLTIDDVQIKREESETVVRINGFTVRDAKGKPLVTAPTGKVSLETMAMLGLKLIPRDVTLEGLSANIEVSETGAVIVSPGTAGTAPAQAEMMATEPALDRLRQAIGGAFAGFAATREAVGGRLPSLGIDDASINLLDRRTGRRYAFSGIKSRLNTTTDGASKAHVEMKSPGGVLAAAFEMSPSAGDGQVFRARTERMTVGALLALAGVRVADIDPAAPVQLSVTAEVDKTLTASAASAEIAVGRMNFLPDIVGGPLHLDEMQAKLSWKDGTSALTFDALRVVGEGMRLSLQGTVTPPSVAGSDAWKIALTSGRTIFEPVSKDDKPVEISRAAAELTVHADTRRLVFEKVEVEGPQVSVKGSGGMALEADGRPNLALQLNVANTDARAALRLWPAFVSPEVRKWLTASLRGGTVGELDLRIGFSAATMDAAFADKPIPDDSLSAKWNITNAVLQVLPGTPPIREGVATGVASGRAVRLDLAGGHVDASPGRRLQLQEGSFVISDTSRDPPDSRTRVRFAGGVDALAEFMRSPGIQPYAPASIDPAVLKGSAEGELTVALRLTSRPSAGDIRIGVAANLRNVSIEKAIAGERLESANLALTVDRDVVQIKGDGKIFGAPATIEVKGSNKARPRVVLTAQVDDAARARKGISLGSMMTGPVALKLSANVDAPDDPDIEVELDFARTKMDGLIPGWTKAAGQPAKAKMDLNPMANGGWQLDSLEVDAGQLSVRGAVTLAADGQFQKAALKTFKLSQGDNTQLDAERSGGVTKISLKGNSFDARPFLRSIQTGAIDKSGGKDTEVTLRTTVLSGFNGEVVANADIKLAMRGGEMKRLDLTGGFDNGGISARMVSRPNAQPMLIIDSEDAGAFLRFFDVYNRMRGGHLNLAASLGSGTQTGTILVRDFVLRNEPAMKRLVADTASTGIGDGARFDPAFVQRLNANQDVRFTKMQVEFARNAGRLDLKDAVIWGQELGGNITGYLDYMRDRVELTGTFVPAYALNNFFAQVPVFGPLLGGGKHEGLFAVRYNITGKVSAPTLSINPLTAIAPGFLRKILDFRSSPGQAAPHPTGTER